jgi:hypothetical protein
MNKIKMQTKRLTKLLKRLLNSESIHFDQVKCLNSSGVYAVLKNKKVIYIGKTTRYGKKRLREMTGDYISHSLNRKLMTELLNKNYKLNLARLRNDDKETLIKEKKLSGAQFEATQKEVNKKIKAEFQIKFIEVSGREMTNLEHFTIGVLSPKYNG